MKRSEMFPVYTDPLEGMQSLSVGSYVPEWLVLAHQERVDRTYVLHHIAKTGYIEAQHVGSDSDLEKPWVPDWPSPREIEAAAERMDECTRRRRTHAHASPAVASGRYGDGFTTEARANDRQTRRSLESSAQQRGGRRSFSPDYVNDGIDEVLVCQSCGDVWLRPLVRGRKPHFCPACR